MSLIVVDGVSSRRLVLMLVLILTLALAVALVRLARFLVVQYLDVIFDAVATIGHHLEEADSALGEPGAVCMLLECGCRCGHELSRQHKHNAQLVLKVYCVGDDKHIHITGAMSSGVSYWARRKASTCQY
jgi:hypothetical protein